MKVSYLALGAVLVAGASYAANPLPPALSGQYPDTVQKTAIGNINSTSGDGFITIYNSGSSSLAGNYGPKATYGWITAEVYVFDASDEQLVACCYCPLSPDSGATMSAKNMLANNTLTGKTPSSITVTLVTAAGNANGGPTTALTPPGPWQAIATPYSFSTGLRGTRTTTHLAANYPGVAGPFVTEAPLDVVNINAGEYDNMVNSCSSNYNNGSGQGICGGCAGGTSNAVVHTHTN